jgi:hypothetical protein
MEQPEAEMADVVVILADPLPVSLEEAIGRLKSSGLAITDVDDENGTIEGTILSIQLTSLTSHVFVQYVRKVFEYTAESPTDDPANENEPK